MKKIVLIGISILLFLSIPVTVFYVGQQQELRKKAAPATSISLAPATIVKAVGDTFSVDIVVDTGGNQASMVSVALQFDPAKLEAQSITNGSLFPQIYTQGEIAAGTASIIVGIEHNAKPVTGNGTAAIVRLKAKEATTSPISLQFGPTTRVTGFGESTPDLLVSRTPATIIIGSSGPTLGGGSTNASPTPIPSLSPTVTISPTLAIGGISSSLSISSLSISSPQTQNPTIQGKALPGSTITLVAPTTSLSTSVTADSNGLWTYTPTTVFKTGTYTIIAMMQNQTTGNIETISTPLTVNCPNSQTIIPVVEAAQETTGSAMPTSGSTSITIVLLILSGMIITVGILTPHIRNT